MHEKDWRNLMSVFRCIFPIVAFFSANIRGYVSRGILWPFLHVCWKTGSYIISNFFQLLQAFQHPDSLFDR